MKILEQAMNLFEIAAPVIGAIFGAAWGLIKVWSKSQEKIKKLEVDKVLKEVSSLNDQIRDHKKVQIGLATILHTTREELIAIKTRLDGTSRNEETFVKSIEYMRQNTDHKISAIEGTLSDGEILKIGTNRFMFKGRLPNKG